MREWCSPAVWRAIENAISGSGGIAGDEIGPEKLLLGLLEDEDGRTTQLLAKYGIERTAFLTRIEFTATAVPISIDRVVADARALSRAHDGEGTATSEYFFLTLLRESAELSALFAEFQLDRGALEREILGEAKTPLQMVDPIRFDETADQLAAGRILDVNANRARESLRILDDYARFILDDAFFTATVKHIRHDLVTLLEALPQNLLLGSRETIHDVGAAIGTASEMERDSPSEVARINLKRLQESLRSLEEFGKIDRPTFAAGIEHLRYRVYTLEKAIGLGAFAHKKLADTRLCVLLTGSQCVAALDWTIAEAAAGGAGIFQLREKNLDDRRLLERARNVRGWTRQADALFIVNDRPDIARLAEADGVHLGQDDMHVREARGILGPDAIIGVSTRSLDQVRQAILDGATYIGVGPAFPSTTKDFDELAGLDFVRRALAETSLPAFAIGGINPETIDRAVAAGAKRIAVSAAIARADEPRQVARTLIDALERR